MLNRLYAIILRQLYVFVASLGRSSDTLFWPVVNLFLWGYLSIYFSQKGGINLLASLLTGYLLWMFLQRSQEDLSVGLLEDLWSRNFINIFATPITIWEYLLGLITTGCLKLLGSFFLVVILTYLLFAFNIFSLGIYLVPFIFNLLLTGWWTGIMINGLIIRFGFEVEALSWTMIFLLMPFSGVFYPVDVLPTWMQTISYILPSSYVFSGMRKLIQDGIFDWNLFVVSLILNIFFMLLSLLFYKKMFDIAKEKGYLVKNY
ncbi:ABC transporter permease [Candidatus Gottesmanbacteria bacterium]|nr:ABC transporter permease [Candidatus Gottesmanbacteria bacterium]